MECEDKITCNLRWCVKNKGCLLQHLESTNGYVSPFTYNFFKENKKKQLAKKKQPELGRVSLKNKANREKIYNKTGGLCHLCGEYVSFETFTIDHALPKSKGGLSNFENLFAAHEECNTKKGNQYPYKSFVKNV